VMERLAAETPAFAGISYRKLAEVSEQWPIVGRGDLYYGGTTYENSQGLGVQLSLTPGPSPALTLHPSPKGRGRLRPKENQWLAVPVTRLYDRGVTVATSGLLAERIGELTVALHPDGAKKLGLDGTAEVRLNGTAARARVVVDENVPASVVLLPRSMGFPIHAPAVAELKKA
jgi:NADH-quinone oxidoreductase subunit G